MAFSVSNCINDGGFPSHIKQLMKEQNCFETHTSPVFDNLSADKTKAISDKFQAVCKETSKQMFDQDLSPYVSYNIKYTTSVPTTYSYKYKYANGDVVPGEPPKSNTTATIGQYADHTYPLTFKIPQNTTVLYTSKCPENGHAPLTPYGETQKAAPSCSTCHKAYMDLFSENIGDNYCRCHG